MSDSRLPAAVGKSVAFVSVAFAPEICDIKAAIVVATRCATFLPAQAKSSRVYKQIYAMATAVAGGTCLPADF